ncbi:MAG: hypothetical protein ABJC04_07270 [Verrucomicrobiota bacterium]
MKQILQTKIEVPLFIQSLGTSIRSLGQAVDKYFHRPFSLSAATILGFVLGVLSPFLLIFLDRVRFQSSGLHYDYNKFPWLSAAPAMVVMALLFWKTRFRNFQWNWRRVMGVILSFVLLSEAAALSYFGCLVNHVCMGGHLEHPPYSREPYAIDSAWAVGLIIATISLVRGRFPFSILAAFVTGFLISMRFIFGSFGRVYPLF